MMRSKQFVVLVAIGLLFALTTGSAVARQETVEDESGTLQVLVQTLSTGGAAPGPDVPAVSPDPTPAAAAVVHVRPAGSDALSDLEQTTDLQGTTMFGLTAGTYWVYLPLQQQPDFPTSGAITPVMSDGTRVLAWAEVVITPATTATCTLMITFALP